MRTLIVLQARPCQSWMSNHDKKDCKFREANCHKCGTSIVWKEPTPTTSSWIGPASRLCCNHSQGCSRYLHSTIKLRFRWHKTYCFLWAKSYLHICYIDEQSRSLDPCSHMYIHNMDITIIIIVATYIENKVEVCINPHCACIPCINIWPCSMLCLISHTYHVLYDQHPSTFSEISVTRRRSPVLGSVSRDEDPISTSVNLILKTQW